MLSGKGTYGIPGLYTETQTASWKKVTEAVHRHGGTIIAQLWHVGRLSHSDLIGGSRWPHQAYRQKEGFINFTNPMNSLMP